MKLTIILKDQNFVKYEHVKYCKPLSTIRIWKTWFLISGLIYNHVPKQKMKQLLK